MARGRSRHGHRAGRKHDHAPRAFSARCPCRCRSRAPPSGGLNIYATKVEAFDDDSVRHGEEVASFVAVAVANAESHAASTEVAHQMQEAMASRSVIDMAKGMLIAQHGCTPDEAFTILSHASQRSNRKLRDIAAAMVGGTPDTRSADTR